MTKRKRNNTQTSTNAKDEHAKNTRIFNSTKTKNSNKNDNAEKPWSKSKKKRMRKLLGGGGTGHRDSQGRDTTTIIDTSTHKNRSKKNKTKRVPKSKDQKDDTDRSQLSAPSVVHQDKAVAADDVTLIAGKQNKPKSALQQAFHARLLGARFRELNEELYTTTSSSALTRFEENPELFEQYHQGFRTQVKSWPVNPVDVIVRWLIALQKQHASRTGGKAKKTKTTKKQKTDARHSLTVADFGCGDAMLARKLLDHQTKTTKGRESFTVHSFDLVSNGNPLITPCDMAEVPLDDGTVDVGVFSLALMGTNIADFIRESHRVLKPDGTLKIAEVRSRFETTAHNAESDDGSGAVEEDGGVGRKKDGGGRCDDSNRTFDQTLLKDFLRVMRQLGFNCQKTDRSNRMFFLMDFKKTGAVPCREATFTAKPCIYKRR